MERLARVDAWHPARRWTNPGSGGTPAGRELPNTTTRPAIASVTNVAAATVSRSEPARRWTNPGSGGAPAGRELPFTSKRPDVVAATWHLSSLGVERLDRVDAWHLLGTENFSSNARPSAASSMSTAASIAILLERLDLARRRRGPSIAGGPASCEPTTPAVGANFVSTSAASSTSVAASDTAIAKPVPWSMRVKVCTRRRACLSGTRRCKCTFTAASTASGNNTFNCTLHPSTAQLISYPGNAMAPAIVVEDPCPGASCTTQSRKRPPLLRGRLAEAALGRSRSHLFLI